MMCRKRATHAFYAYAEKDREWREKFWQSDKTKNNHRSKPNAIWSQFGSLEVLHAAVTTCVRSKFQWFDIFFHHHHCCQQFYTFFSFFFNSKMKEEKIDFLWLSTFSRLNTLRTCKFFCSIVCWASECTRNNNKWQEPAVNREKSVLPWMGKQHISCSSTAHLPPPPALALSNWNL